MSWKFFGWVAGGLMFLLLVVVGLGAGDSFLEFFIFNLDTDGVELSEIRNPVLGLSDEEAIDAFDEEFVLFLLYSINVHELRNAPISFEEPRMEILVDDKIYNARVEKGRVYVGVGEIEREDVIVKTSASEAVKMLRDKNYISSSFRSGGSTMELVAGRAKLFGKGYLSIYESVTN